MLGGGHIEKLTGARQHQDVWGTLETFVGAKAHPSARFAQKAMSGGRDFGKSIYSWEWLSKNFAPFFTQTVVELEGEPEMGAFQKSASGLLAFYGTLGTQAYPKPAENTPEVKAVHRGAELGIDEAEKWRHKVSEQTSEDAHAPSTKKLTPKERLKLGQWARESGRPTGEYSRQMYEAQKRAHTARQSADRLKTKSEIMEALQGGNRAKARILINRAKTRDIHFNLDALFKEAGVKR